MDVAALLRERLQASSTLIEKLVRDQDANRAYAVTFDCLHQFDACSNVIALRKEATVFQYAVTEFQFAQFALGLGLYRQAFSSLRLTLEMSLATVAFSANEMKLRQWLKDDGDIFWSEIIHEETGVLGSQFAQAFFPDLSTHVATYRAMATKVYRECSEYVHGNADTHSNLPREIEYSRDIVLSWCDKADVVRRAILFAFLLRYSDDLDDTQREIMEPVWCDALGHIEAVRFAFGGPTGG